jgi:lipoprotein-anchoring transpeptidase ErfK/SrfK
MMLLSSLALSLVLAQAAAAPPATRQPAAPPAQPKADAAAQKVLDALAVQVALDRAGFSPGAIDGSIGPSTKKALEAYRQANGAGPQPADAVTGYEITEADAAGPFQPQIPSELPDQAKLERLAYRDVVEMIAERFHTTPALLKKLNPAAKFAPGEQIAVPNVEPLQIPASGETQTEPAAKEKPASKEKPAKGSKPVGTAGRGAATESASAAPGKPDVIVTVSKSLSALVVTDASGKTLMYAPVTTGSEHDPLPIGEWKVNGITLNPPFRYNPDLFWDADPTHTKALIKPGPNNPVGLVWIDLSKEHYGIHGSPEPASIGRSQSHGCVRLTNWDAVRLATFVKPGTKVVFKP